MQNLKSQFLLREDITFLNFGSFGACPKPVFERYQQYQLELEQEPVNFVTSKALKYLYHSREALGDEVLTTDLEYGACDKTWDYYCRKAKAKYVRQPIPLPIESKEHFVEAFFKGLTAKTKLIFISHITSTTGLRFPVEEICAIAKEKGILTFVDGAHAPGHILLDLQTLTADFYI